MPRALAAARVEGVGQGGEGGHGVTVRKRELTATACARAHVHLQRLPRPQVHLRLDLDRLPGHERQREPAREIGDVRVHLDQREVFADARARDPSRTEGTQSGCAWR